MCKNKSCKLILIPIVLLVYHFVAAQTNLTYNVKGNIIGLQNKTIYLGPAYITEGGDADTTLYTFSKNGEFEFSGIHKEPRLYSMTVEGGKASLPVVIAGENIVLTGSFDDLSAASISGSKENTIYQEYTKLKASLSDTAILRKFINTYPESFTALYACITQSKLPAETILDLLSLLDVSLRNHSFYRRLENKARAEIRLRINMPAPDFSIVASAHDTFMLSKLKGKYVLLDFWASWCAPCRSANQHLKKMLQTYKNKGFEVVSFSIDEKEKEWKKAVERDAINWVSLIDYAGWKSKTAVLYDVQTIPACFLIDREGKIIAKNLSPEELEDKLKLLLK